MEPLKYIDRTSRSEKVEEVYGGKALNFLYGRRFSSRLIGLPLSHLLAKLPFISALVGWWQKQPWTKRKIIPFIKRFNMDAAEFLEPVSSFRSFNDFFVRKLKRDARPIAPGASTAVIPADGRYRFIPNISAVDGFIVKGHKFSLKALLGDSKLADDYASGSMVLARLCPTDYHRFHFPCDGTPGPARLIRGDLYSVNPIALKKNINIYTLNKRKITQIETEAFGKILYLEVGATNVGSIHETYTPGQPCQKGDEKGFFSFGGSALVLLFPAGSIRFDQDLLDTSQSGLEVYCQMGQSMGVRI